MRMETMRIIRQRLKLNKTDMADELGISKSQINYIEDVAQSINTQLLLAYFDRSGMSADEYLASIRSDAKRRPKKKAEKK